MHEQDSFAAFCKHVVLHAACVCHLHMLVCRDRIFDFYALVVRDFKLLTLEQFSIQNKYGFRDDSCNDALSTESFFPKSKSLNQLMFREALPLYTQLTF